MYFLEVITIKPNPTPLTTKICGRKRKKERRQQMKNETEFSITMLTPINMGCNIMLVKGIVIVN